MMFLNRKHYSKELLFASVAILICLCTGIVVGQPAHEFHIDDTISIEGSARGLVAGDTIGNGQVRIVVGSNKTGYVYVFKYQNGDYIEEWSSVVVPDAEIIPTAVGDVDNDGQPEFLVNVFGMGKIYVYEWTGETYKLVLEQRIGGGSYYMPAAVADLDRDGKNELIIDDGKINVYKYSAPDGIFEKIWSAPDGNVLQISVGDVDGDGKMEAVCTSSWETTPRIMIIGYNGVGYAVEANITGFPKTLGGIGVADMDGDGRAEMITATFNVAADEYPIFIVESNGSNYVVQQIYSASMGMFQIHTGDIDGDSIEEANILRNGAGSFVVDTDAAGYYLLEVDHTGACVFGDVADTDNDGRDEIIAAGGTVDIVSGVTSREDFPTQTHKYTSFVLKVKHPQDFSPGEVFSIDLGARNISDQTFTTGDITVSFKGEVVCEVMTHNATALKQLPKGSKIFSVEKQQSILSEDQIVQAVKTNWSPGQTVHFRLHLRANSLPLTALVRVTGKLKNQTELIFEPTSGAKDQQGLFAESYIFRQGPGKEILSNTREFITFVKTLSFYRTLGDEPAGIAVDRSHNRIYIANSASHTISVVDGATNEIIGEIDISNWARQPIRVAIDTHKAYIACLTPPSVLVLDLSTNQPTKIINLDQEPLEIASDPQKRRIYVLSKESLIILDANNDTIIKKINVPPEAQDIAVNPNTGKVYIAGKGLTVLLSDATLVQIPDLPKGELIPDLPEDEFGAIAVNPTTNRVYAIHLKVARHNGAISRRSMDIYVIDGARDRFLSTIKPPSSESPIDLDVNPLTDQIYVSLEGHSSTWGWSGGYFTIDGKSNQPGEGVGLGDQFYDFIVVNPTTGLVYIRGPRGISVVKGIERVTLLPESFDGVVGLALNPITHKLYLVGIGGQHNWDRGFVIELNTEKVKSLQVDNLAPNATSPTSLLVDSGNNRIYVGNTTGGGWSGSAGVVVIDGEKDEIDESRWPEGRIRLGVNTEIIAVDPKTNKLFVKEEWGNRKAVIDAVTGEVSELQGPVPPTAIKRPKTIQQITSPITHRVYMPVPNENAIAIWDKEVKTKLGQFKVAASPIAITFDPKLGQIDVVDSRGNIAVFKEITGSAQVQLVSVQMPDSAQIGIPFQMTVSAQVTNSDSPKGGITISFSKPVEIKIQSSSAPAKIYPLGSKIWNQELKGVIESIHPMVELWVEYWHKERIHQLSLDVTPFETGDLDVFIRATAVDATTGANVSAPREGVFDQQGFPCEKRTIRISQAEREAKVLEEKIYSIIDKINFHGEQSIRLYQIGTAEFKIFPPKEDWGGYFEAYNKGEKIYTSEPDYTITNLFAFRYKDHQYISISDWVGAAHGYGSEYIFSLDKTNNLKLLGILPLGSAYEGILAPEDSEKENLFVKNGKLYLRVGDERFASFYGTSFGSSFFLNQYFLIENDDLIQSNSDFKEYYLKEARDYENKLEDFYQRAKIAKEEKAEFHWNFNEWLPFWVGKIVSYLMAGEEEKAWSNFEEYLTRLSLISQQLVTITSQQTINPQKLKEDIIDIMTRELIFHVVSGKRKESPPRFEDFPISEAFKGKPAQVNLSSHPRAPKFRTRLTEGAKEGPNFAGHYTVISWGCGTACQEVAVVDTKTGIVYFAPFTTSFGVAFRLNSNLLIANPPEEIEAAFEATEIPSWVRSDYYKWENNQFVLISSQP